MKTSSRRLPLCAQLDPYHLSGISKAHAAAIARRHARYRYDMSHITNSFPSLGSHGCRSLGPLEYA